MTSFILKILTSGLLDKLLAYYQSANTNEAEIAKKHIEAEIEMDYSIRTTRGRCAPASAGREVGRVARLDARHPSHSGRYRGSGR